MMILYKVYQRDMANLGVSVRDPNKWDNECETQNYDSLQYIDIRLLILINFEIKIL